jgi:hypothetical protein
MAYGVPKVDDREMPRHRQEDQEAVLSAGADEQQSATGRGD